MLPAPPRYRCVSASTVGIDSIVEGAMRLNGAWLDAAYASAIRAITLVANGSLPHDFAIGVDFTVGFDVAGAAATV